MLVFVRDVEWSETRAVGENAVGENKSVYVGEVVVEEGTQRVSSSSQPGYSATRREGRSRKILRTIDTPVG